MLSSDMEQPVKQMTESEWRHFEFCHGYYDGVGHFHEWLGLDFGEPAFMYFHRPDQSPRDVYGVGARKGWEDAITGNVRLTNDDTMTECESVLRGLPTRMKGVA